MVAKRRPPAEPSGSRNREVPVGRMWRSFFFFLLLTLVGCIRSENDSAKPMLQSNSKTLFVHVPDHPKFNPGSFVIGDEKIDASVFEAELRTRLSSKLYVRIELSTGKAGDAHFEALVKQIANENQTAIELLPRPRGSL